MKQIKLVTIIVFLSFYAVSQPKYNSNFIHLPLDGNTNDTSINKNNAIYYGGTFVNDRYGKANKALSLDGVDDYILIKNIGNSLPTTNYSISFWLKTEKGDQKSANTFMLMPDNTDNRFSASIYYSHSGTSSHFVDFGSIGKRLFFQPDLPDGNWNFFEIIMTKDSLSLYKNGTLKSYLHSPDQFTARNGDLAIGMGIDGYIKGIIDDFKISYNNVQRNLINGFLYLPFDENTLDSTINLRNATKYGNAKYATDRYGKANKALSLDGVDDYILIKNIGNSLPTTNYSISFWLKTEKGDQKSANTFMLMPDNTDNRFSASIYYSHSGTSSHFVDFGSIGKRLFFQPDLPDGNWNFFEIIMTKDSLSLYKNGTLKSYLLSPDQFTARNGDLAIGMGIDGYIKGIIDDFKINIIPIVNNYNNNYDNVKFSLFPNPNNSNIFYFENSAPFQIISLCNNIGQNINYELSNNSLTIDANNGIYFIKCISNGDTFIKKLVINKL